MQNDPTKIRNIAIIAHVDHGKTTLVDGLLKQSHIFRENQIEMSQTLIMDSGDQEKERGITITAKITAVEHSGVRINIIDTPGHADFGGEVERTLNMADGCLLIVDAAEGPMPQTKFVLERALTLNLKPIVVINKIDKPAARVSEVEDELADLFLELAVHEDQLHYPTYYCVARDGKAWPEMPVDTSEDTDLACIFDAIINEVKAPAVEVDKPFQMLVSALDFDSYKGKYAIGKISRGQVKQQDSVVICQKSGGLESFKIEKIYVSVGTGKLEVDEAVAGNIVQITGSQNIKIGETIADSKQPEALTSLEVSEPTLEVYIGPNTSPMKGIEGKFTTSRQIADRLARELETNIGLRVKESGIGFNVAGRGELHLSVLIETMRREGYEFEVGRPQVLLKKASELDSKQADAWLEPVEELIIEVPSEHAGAVQTELAKRRATAKEQFANDKGITKLIYELPTRAILGLRNILVTNTKGTIVMNNLPSGYQLLGQPLPRLRSGVLIAFETGTTMPYSLETAEARGTLFLGPAEKVYQGQIVGQNNRYDDLEINVCKAKHLTNMRSKSSDGAVQLTPPTIFSLEQCLDFIEDDELLEVTPQNLRLRKKELDPIKRKRATRRVGAGD